MKEEKLLKGHAVDATTVLLRFLISWVSKFEESVDVVNDSTLHETADVFSNASFQTRLFKRVFSNATKRRYLTEHVHQVLPEIR